MLTRVIVVTLTAASFAGGLGPPPVFSPAPMATASGIFVKAASGKLTRIPSEWSTDAESSGKVKSALSQGFSQPTMVARFRGAVTPFVISDPQPTFVFRFVETNMLGIPKPESPTPGADLVDAPQLVGKSPKQYMLAKLVVEGDARMASNKNMTTFKFDATSTATREFDVRPAQPLEPGEYAFYMSGVSPSLIWAFSLKR